MFSLFLQKIFASKEAATFWIITYWLTLIIAVVTLLTNCNDMQCLIMYAVLFGFILWIIYHNLRMVQITRKKMKKKNNQNEDTSEMM
jgi:uncharacterized membrane protein YagU involved in acid resistance